MNIKGIAVISIIVVLVVSIAFLSTTQQFEESMRPTIESDLTIHDDTSLSLNYDDTPLVSDSESTVGSDVTVTVDEDGKKQYTIEVGDTPSIQE